MSGQPRSAPGASQGPANLPGGEVEQLAEWFLNLMDVEQRGRLMAELPQIYARMYPGVKAEIITARVTAAIHAGRHPKISPAELAPAAPARANVRSTATAA
jgi:hypothetical protein